MRKSKFDSKNDSAAPGPNSGTAVLGRLQPRNAASARRRGRSAPDSRPAVDGNAARLAAIERSHAVAEFDMSGTLLSANRNFLETMGYTLEEIEGKHHGIFVEEEYRHGSEYEEFWAALRKGEYRSGEFKRIAKNGNWVWLQASYDPILDASGRPYRVVSFATDVTPGKRAFRLMAGHIDRIGRGDIPAKITERCEGGFAALKESINACIDGLGGLVEANTVLQRMARNDYTQRVAGNYQGIFADVAGAVNATEERVDSVLEAVQRVSSGDLSGLAQLRRIGKRSEHDRIVPAMILLIETLESLVREIDELARGVMNGRLGLRANSGGQNGDFRKIVDGINRMMDLLVEPIGAIAHSVAALASSSEEMAAVSRQMAGNAEETATQASVVSAAAGQVSRNVASVASAAEQMQASIREIAKNAAEATRVTQNAVTAAQSANRTIAKLGESGQEIGNVIKVISSIAQQTNLLALNATIEAARAGEAGKGFAVVANEVKELAKQTAQATEDIGRKIEAIQGDTRSAVGAIEEIGGIIGRINDISSSIATAVEEQTVTTNEIGRSVSEASRGVENIAQNIGGVASAAKNTTEGANETQKASEELSRMAAQIQSVIARFTF